MKIQITQSACGADFVRNVGDIIDLPNKEAIRIIESGAAVPVRSTKKEKAVKNG